jgi:uracil-DNA glycosylase
MTNILILGEAWGENEEREQAPFVGYSGHELTRMLSEAGINRADCYLTNVFNLRPAGNKIETLCGPKDLRLEGYPQLGKGGYILARYRPELERLQTEIIEVSPNLILCLGNTALWAMGGVTTISKLRGSTRLSTHTVTGVKLLPTYHPAAVVRQWDLRPIVVMDFIKAERESHYPDIRRPERQIFIPETIGDLYEFDQQYMRQAKRLSVDIETSGNQITCIGFAPSQREGLVIPIFDSRKRDKCYWTDGGDELAAWRFIKQVCERPTPKIFQNGMYDIAFLLRSYGIKVMSAEHDTMLLHHALQPESLKGLGFLGSIYTDEGSWKSMREVGTIKRDD